MLQAMVYTVGCFSLHSVAHLHVTNLDELSQAYQLYSCRKWSYVEVVCMSQDMPVIPCKVLANNLGLNHNKPEKAILHVVPTMAPLGCAVRRAIISNPLHKGDTQQIHLVCAFTRAGINNSLQKGKTQQMRLVCAFTRAGIERSLQNCVKDTPEVKARRSLVSLPPLAEPLQPSTIRMPNFMPIATPLFCCKMCSCAE